jgi:tellurite resistance protein TerC
MDNSVLTILFTLFILGMLALDLGVFHRRAHAISIREAGLWSLIWIVLSIGFGIGLYFWKGPESSIQFFTGYVLEKSLSMDNVFLFTVIFSSLAVPPKYQHKLLFWGVLGALTTRAIFITAGVALIARFEWIVYIFGLFLIIGGIKLLCREREGPDPERNRIVRWVRDILPIAQQSGGAFFLRRNGRLFATPLFLALIMVELTDIALALDSIPAAFAVTRDSFIVYASNIFAMLGLRALYFLLGAALARLRYLHVGLAAILIFVGLKMLIGNFFDVPVLLSLAIICAILLGTILVSMRAARPERELVESGSGR